MSKKLGKIFLLGLISLIVPAMLWAQDNKKANAASSLYLISAKAGAVNYVSGKVSLERNDAKKSDLQQGDTVEVGDKVSTETDGKAEVLLNPGSYIRLAGNSEFEFLTTSLDDLQLKVNRGSAIFEVIADKDFSIKVYTPNSRFYLITAGVFRVDVLENGVGKIFVWKGKAQLGDLKATVVKSGKTGMVAENQVMIEKFDKDNKGEFDIWSKERAKTIAKINEKLIQKQMRQSLMNSFNNNGWSTSNGYGLWVQDPWSRNFCFLPFGWGWRSPYGFGFNQSIWNYNPPPQMIAPIYQNQNVNNPSYSQPVMNPPSSVMPSGNSGSPMSPPSSQPPPTREVERPRMDRPNIVERKRDPIDN